LRRTEKNPRDSLRWKQIDQRHDCSERQRETESCSATKNRETISNREPYDSRLGGAQCGPNADSRVRRLTASETDAYKPTSDSTNPRALREPTNPDATRMGNIAPEAASCIGRICSAAVGST